MVNQLTTEEAGLRLFFTDEIYLVREPEVPSAPILPAALVQEPAVPLVKKTEDFKFLGNNGRNILILVNDDQNEVSSEKGRELLRKIVKSINLTASDFALLNYASYKGSSFEQLENYFSGVIVLAFGVTAGQLGLQDHPLNTVVYEGSVKLIFSAALTDLDEDPNGKKVLWGCLKQLGL